MIYGSELGFGVLHVCKSSIGFDLFQLQTPNTKPEP
jgi:hypothetical protein